MTKQNYSACNRRYFLLGVGGSVAALAGCSEGADSSGNGESPPEQQIRDSDGDGVIDSEDYAPQDPEVQSKSDIEGAVTEASEPTATITPTSSPTPTQTPTPSPTPEPTPTPTPEPTPTPTPTPQVQDSVNTLQAKGLGSAAEMVSEYSAAEMTVQIMGETDIETRRGKVLATISRYPDGELQAYGSGGVVTLPDSGNRTYTVQLDNGSVPRNERLHYQTFIMPEDETYETAEGSDLDYIGPSDPFRITSSNRIVRDLPPALPGETSTSGFERNDIEGSFELQWSGTTDGRSWSIGFIIHKYAYSEMRNEPRGRDYDEYVAVAQNSGLAEEMATLVNADLEASGFTSGPYKIAAVIDWIQSFPYVTDDVYEGYDEYPKFPVETLTEVGGDCEDTAILMAGLLQSDPFNYDMVLVSPPGHMAAGIYSEERQGRYYTYDGRDYYYIETTGSGWGIGDMPEDYVGTSASIYQV